MISALELQSSLNIENIIHVLSSFEPTSQASFNSYCSELINNIQKLINNSELSAEKFHEVRWSLKKFLNLFYLLKQAGSEYTNKAVYEYLYRLNLELGVIHDDVVAADLRGECNYYDQIIKVPPHIQSLVRIFCASFTIVTAARVPATL